MLTIQYVPVPTPGFLIDFSPDTLPDSGIYRHLYVALITILHLEPLRIRREFLPILRANDHPHPGETILLPLTLLHDGDLLEMPTADARCLFYQYTTGSGYELRPLTNLVSVLSAIVAPRRQRRILLEAPPCAS